MAETRGESRQTAVPWHRLRAWISEQEAWESTHNRPAQLTPAQIVAITTLIPPIEEPDLGFRDYVSDLCEYLQSKQLSLPEFESDSVTFSVGKMPQLRWRCFCTLSRRDGVFPREGYGFVAGEEPPSFQAKKKAKQFAAKQALAFLYGSPPETTTGDITEDIFQTTRPISPAPKRVKVEQDPVVKREPSLGLNDRQPGSSEDDGGPTIAERVAGLAVKLNLCCPSYKIDEDPDQPGLWRGRPDFQQDPRVPEDLGIVRGILGKKQAKLAIAEKVLVWLEAEDRARQETADRLLATMNPLAGER